MIVLIGFTRESENIAIVHYIDFILVGVQTKYLR